VEGFDVLTEFVPNQRITDRSSRSFVGTWTTTFEPEGSGTRLTEQRQPVSFWPLRPLDRLMDRFRGKLNQQSLEKVRAELERPEAPTAIPAASGTDG
jgi:hypothetical protein